MLRRFVLVASVACAVALLGSTSASASTTIGQVGTGAAPQECAETNLLQSSVDSGTPYVVPAGGGVITSWRHLGGVVPGSGKLLMWRAAGGSNFTVIGKSDLQTFTSGVVREFPASIPVSGGDLVGMRVVDDARNCLQGGLPPGNVLQGEASPAPEPAIGETRALTALSGLRLNVAATLEPDCDRDGLGDETQDTNLNSCPPGPSVTITGAPKDKVKTKKKRKNVTFTFSASEPGATFNCVLDGKQEFKTCTSPLTVSVKKGRHTFSVQATDSGGNQGAAAADTFKVKRKRK